MAKALGTLNPLPQAFGTQNALVEAFSTQNPLTKPLGTQNPLAEALGVPKEADGLGADRDGRTSIDGLYVIGWSTRLKKIQAIISAGDGACAALDILSAKAGEDLHDFDLIEDEK